MENYSLLMGGGGDEDGGGDGSGVDGEAFRGTSRSGRNETPVPRILASRWRRLWKVSRPWLSLWGFDAGALYEEAARGSKGDDTIGWRGPTQPHHHVIWATGPYATLGVTAASAGRRTPERKELSGGQESAGKFPPGGEIDAIVTVIDLDIISITITIIFIIITAITTAGHRHRCSNLEGPDGTEKHRVDEIPTAVVHTKGVMLTTAQTLKKEQLLRERGLGLGVVFVHTLTNTDLKGNGLIAGGIGCKVFKWIDDPLDAHHKQLVRDLRDAVWDRDEEIERLQVEIERLQEEKFLLTARKQYETKVIEPVEMKAT
ncbi:hypothetical protein QYE76_067220 [Lolium multiflorum]|uniref:Uncharacterized protein n=1 Tax=Lolium multiflorum TaxID=4521 RepID=A0AAD8WBG9_LOLMU|nr:hypothetical protein QYE76_067220 [Lolium multiflorum]